MEFEKVRDIIVETLGCDAEEEATGISIEDEALAQMKTVGDVLAYLESHKQ